MASPTITAYFAFPLPSFLVVDVVVVVVLLLLPLLPLSLLVLPPSSASQGNT